jgi:hypothetical protein
MLSSFIVILWGASTVSGIAPAMAIMRVGSLGTAEIIKSRVSQRNSLVNRFGSCVGLQKSNLNQVVAERLSQHI